MATERMAWGQVRMLRRYNPDIPVLIYVPLWQTWREADFDAGAVRSDCQWAGGDVSQRGVHFGGTGKGDPVYDAWLERCVAVSPGLRDTLIWRGILR